MGLIRIGLLLACLSTACSHSAPAKALSIAHPRTEVKIYSDNLKALCLMTSKNDGQFMECIGQKYEDLK